LGVSVLAVISSLVCITEELSGSPFRAFPRIPSRLYNYKIQLFNWFSVESIPMRSTPQRALHPGLSIGFLLLPPEGEHQKKPSSNPPEQTRTLSISFYCSLLKHPIGLLILYQRPAATLQCNSFSYKNKLFAEKTPRNFIKMMQENGNFDFCQIFT